MGDWMNHGIIGYRDVASSVRILGASEPDPGRHIGGIYIGTTAIYSLPFFLDYSKMVNPHMSIIGMSGSGKTYLLKSIIARASIYLGVEIVILDWTGEYREIGPLVKGSLLTVSHDRSNGRLGLIEAGSGREVEWVMPGSFILDISELPDDSLRYQASKMLIMRLLDGARRKGVSKSLKRIVVLDEAWKAIEAGGMLSSLYREGRKYGLGVITATQMGRDLNNEIIANSGTIALFRLQSEADYEILQRSQIVTSTEIRKISDLKVGSCIMVISEASGGAPLRFQIKRVSGVEFKHFDLFSDRMNVEISESRMKSRLADSGVRGQDADAIINRIGQSSNRISLIELVRFMRSLRISRHLIVCFLRILGFDDLSIVEAYESS
jgi:hypothetical protein